MLLLLDELLRDVGLMATVPDRPALAPWYRVAGDDARLVFEHAHRAVVLEGAAVGALVTRLLPLLDGTRTLDELVASLELPRDAVEHALVVLAGRGLLVAGPPADVEPELRAVVEQVAAAFGLAPGPVAAALASARVAVAGESRTADEVERLLVSAGLRVTRVAFGASVDAELAIAAPANGELSALRRVNQVALRDRLAWLQVLPFDGRFAAVGPLVLPGETACGSCYALRRGASLRFGEIEDVLAPEPPRAPAGAIVETIAAATAAAIAVRWLGARDPRLPGVLHAVEAHADVRITRHHVLRVPRCPDCSDARRLARPAPWFDPMSAAAA